MQHAMVMRDVNAEGESHQTLPFAVIAPMAAYFLMVSCSRGRKR